MELRQLEYFVAVAEEANFTRAAQRVHVSQSGVSAQIRQLERELGAALFDRSARSATLTAAGEAALDHARAALAAAGAVSGAVGATSQLLRSRVSLGMVVGCTISPLFEALAAFHTAHPGVEVTVREGDSAHMADDVRRGSLDLALVGCAGRPPEALESLTIVSEGLVALVACDHPLAACREATLAEVTAHRLVCMPPGTGLRAVLDQACAAQNLRPTVAVQASAADAIVDLAARGLAVGILSESMAQRYRPRVQVLPIRDIAVPALLALVWRQAANPAALGLVDHCRVVFRPDPAADPGR